VMNTLVARTTPLFSNFLFKKIFLIRFLYFFIISSLFPYLNLFVSIFIQSHVNIWIYFIFRNHNPDLSLFKTYHQVCNKSNTTGAKCGAETAYPLRASNCMFRLYIYLYRRHATPQV
jgi:hypothetical protein